MTKEHLQVLIKQFNQPETILVISKYPHKNIGESFHGVAVYTRDTLTAITDRTRQKFVVLVEQAYGRQAELQANGQILLLPCFSNSPLSVFWQLQAVIHQFDQVANIQLHSEFYNSGNLLQMTLLLPFLAQLRLEGKIVSYVAHNVVSDFSFLNRHLADVRASLLRVVSHLVPWYYRLLSLTVEQFITLDQAITHRLQNYLWQPQKVKSSFIWLKDQRPTQQQTARFRQQLAIQPDELVLAVFGFMSQYKGVDWLVKSFLKLSQEQPNLKVKLLLAGGPAPSQQDKRSYQLFYRRLAKLAARDSGIILTGFIAESDLARYYSVADLVLLPYRGILGGSASWATALSYGKACLFSQELQAYLQAPDVQLALKKSQLQEQDLLFRRNFTAFKRLLNRLQNKPQDRQKLQKFSTALLRLRQEEAAVYRDYPALFFPRETDKICKSCLAEARNFPYNDQ